MFTICHRTTEKESHELWNSRSKKLKRICVRFKSQILSSARTQSQFLITETDTQKVTLVFREAAKLLTHSKFTGAAIILARIKI